MTPWLVSWGVGLFLALLFNRGAFRKPSPRRAVQPNPPTAPTRGGTSFVPVGCYSDPGTETTGLLAVDGGNMAGGNQ